MKCPDFAAKVWYADGEYYAELAEGGTSHTLRLSGGDLLELIRHRTSDSKLTTAGNKTQYQIDKCLLGSDDLVAEFLSKGLQPAKKKTKYTPEQRKAANALLKLVGLK